MSVLPSISNHGGVIVPMVTPVTSDGSLDEAGALRLLARIEAGGAHGGVAARTGRQKGFLRVHRRRPVDGRGLLLGAEGIVPGAGNLAPALCRELYDAARRVRRIARRLALMKPEWVFKKADSVLRGNVLPEVEALRRV